MSENKTRSYLEALQNGKATVVKEIYESSFPIVLKWMLSNNGTRQDALDIFHDALEVIIYQVHQTESSIWSIDFEPYVFRICRNKWIDVLRKKKSFVEKVSNHEKNRLKENERDYSTIENDGTKQLHLKKALERTYLQISETCRSIIELMNAGLSSAEIAKELSMTNTNTFYRRKFACLKRWKEIMKSDSAYRAYVLEYGG